MKNPNPVLVFACFFGFLFFCRFFFGLFAQLFEDLLEVGIHIFSCYLSDGCFGRGFNLPDVCQAGGG
ncbi:hypothetical protein FBS47_01200 [Neisseria gonorrhoeae]